MKYVKIPDDRTRKFRKDFLKRISEDTRARIRMDEDANLSIRHENSIKEVEVKEVIEALTVGFSYNNAHLLYEKDLHRLEFIDIRKQTRNKKDFRRQKGRIIGENGRCKDRVEELTDVSIEVAGEKVGIIGNISDCIKAKRAILSLISGTPHSGVYRELEKYKRKKKKPMALKFQSSARNEELD